jgi:cysteinyl-tRNA synthetase
MSKSRGNFFLVRDIGSRFRPLAVRLFLLATHYRSPIDFDDAGLQAAEKGLERLENTRRSWRSLLPPGRGRSAHPAMAAGQP